MGLGQEGHFPRQSLTGKIMDLALTQADRAAGCGNHAVHGLEEGALAAAVGADDGCHLPFGQGYADIMEDGPPAAPDDEVLDGNGISHGSHFLPQEK